MEWVGSSGEVALRRRHLIRHLKHVVRLGSTERRRCARYRVICAKALRWEMSLLSFKKQKENPIAGAERGGWAERGHRFLGDLRAPLFSSCLTPLASGQILYFPFPLPHPPVCFILGLAPRAPGSPRPEDEQELSWASPDSAASAWTRAHSRPGARRAVGGLFPLAFICRQDLFHHLCCFSTMRWAVDREGKFRNSHL